MENSKPIIGLIAEFNPFHNGHIYLIKKIKEQFPDCFLIVALTSDVTQRGELTVASFEDRKNIALSYGVNKVVQLSDYETVQAAHIFVANAINLLLKENISHHIVLKQKLHNFQVISFFLLLLHLDTIQILSLLLLHSLLIYHITQKNLKFF